MTIFAGLGRYDARPGVPFAAWLARVAANRCRDALRAEARRPRTVALDASPAAGEWLDALVGAAAPPVGDALAARELVELLLARLTARDRALIVLLDLDERPLAEVAATLGLNRIAIRVAAMRARARLRAAAKRLRDERP